mmetsp:Transcript_33659/g.78667  ORF Transcript_33659/g.78667 Transcript_33659/m.78667 type:complete len:396 (-) Transcript_33659:339-1526(-)
MDQHCNVLAGESRASYCREVVLRHWFHLERGQHVALLGLGCDPVAIFAALAAGPNRSEVAVANCKNAPRGPRWTRHVAGATATAACCLSLAGADLEVSVGDDPATSPWAFGGQSRLWHEAVGGMCLAAFAHHIHCGRLLLQTQPFPEGATLWLICDTIYGFNPLNPNPLICVAGSPLGQRAEAPWATIHQSDAETWKAGFQVASPLHALVISANHQHASALGIKVLKYLVLRFHLAEARCDLCFLRRGKLRFPLHCSGGASRHPRAASGHQAVLVADCEDHSIWSRQYSISWLKLGATSLDKLHVLVSGSNVLVGKSQVAPQARLAEGSQNPSRMLRELLRISQEDGLSGEDHGQVLQCSATSNTTTQHQSRCLQIREDNDDGLGALYYANRSKC